MKRSIFFLSLLVVISCKQESDVSANEIKGKILKIGFATSDTFNNNDWLHLDHVHFIHKEDILSKQKDKIVDNSVYFVPASYIYTMAGKSGIQEKISGISIALGIADHLKHVTDREGRPIFSISAGPELLVEGTITLRRLDEKPLTVTTIEGYPANISIINQ